MSIRRSIAWSSVCVVILAFAASAQAQERNYWRYRGGHFENTSGNRWEERTEDKTFHFTEIDRTEKYVELLDNNRKLIVRLYDDRQEDKPETGGHFAKIHDG